MQLKTNKYYEDMKTKYYHIIICTNKMQFIVKNNVIYVINFVHNQ